MSTQKPNEERDYKYSDGTLEQLANYIKGNLERDLADLTAHNVDSGTVTALDDLRTDFINLPTDLESRGEVTDAVEEKETAVNTGLTMARTLRTAAANVFGEGKGKYNRFGFTHMDKLNDVEMPRAFRAMKRVATTLQTLLAGEGIDTTFLDNFGTATTAIDTKLEGVKMKEEGRETAADDRIGSGNTLHLEVTRLSRICKDVYFSTNESKYNDYVIEHFVGSNEGITHDYNIKTLLVPANGSVLVDVGTVAMPLLDLYARAINGDVMMCTTDLPADPCTAGYALMNRVTFHGPITGTGLDTTKTSLQLTNPSLSDVTVRIGPHEGI